MIRIKVGLEYKGEINEALEQQATKLVGFMRNGGLYKGGEKDSINYFYWVCYHRGELKRVMIALLDLVTDQVKIIVSGNVNITEWED